MGKRVKLLMGLAMVLLAACTEDIVIDVEEGSTMIGVEATFTDELKHHEAILSYSADFYNKEIRMVSGATVYLTDGVDTIYYHEDAERKGHYFTDLVAGQRDVMYRFCADVPDEREDDGWLHLSAESLMTNNVETIDSLIIKPFNGGNDSIPNVFFGDTIEWVYPYFQSLPDPTMVYMPMISKNDTLLTDTLTSRMIIPIGGYAGFYVNGPEMQAENKEIPVHYFMKSELRIGDRIRADLYSIPADYLYFYYTVVMSNGSNPMLGAPANVVSNIQPSGKAMGWFLTASVVSAEVVFLDAY